jgi:hypothetical protein
MTTFESVAEFLKRGGKITVARPRHAKNAQKKQQIKVPFRLGKLVG